MSKYKLGNYIAQDEEKTHIQYFDFKQNKRGLIKTVKG